MNFDFDFGKSGENVASVEPLQVLVPCADMYLQVRVQKQYFLTHAILLFGQVPLKLCFGKIHECGVGTQLLLSYSSKAQPSIELLVLLVLPVLVVCCR